MNSRWQANKIGAIIENEFGTENVDNDLLVTENNAGRNESC